MKIIKQFYSLLLLLTIGCPIVSTAQTLNTGDVVIIGYAADTGPSGTVDEFSWVPLVDLVAGTKIYFTDAGYNTIDADFMGTGLNDEILIKYTVPESGIPARTVFTVTESMLPSDYTIISGSKFGNDFNGQLSLPNAGDQITVFQSTDDENVPATFGDTNFTPLFMVNGSSLSFTALNSAAADITPIANIDNLTNLVPGLTLGVNAIATGSGPLEADESDNARYNGTLSGTRDEVLFAVSQLSNWTRYDEAFGNDIVLGSAESGWTTKGTLSIPENELALQITLFPNPSKNTVAISNLTKKTVQNMKLVNANGQLLYQVGKFQSSIDLSGLANGLYFLKLEFENNTTVIKKIIKV